MMESLRFIFLFAVSFSSFGESCFNYGGSWGEFQLNKISCEVVHIVIPSTTYRCTGWPYCEGETTNRERVEAILNVRTGKCSPGRDYSYYCSEYIFKFQNGTILLSRPNNGSVYIVLDPQHGQCSSSMKKLSYDSSSQSIISQLNLSNCKDGYNGWSAPKVVATRKNN
jgi:hypothetical protein